MVLCGLIRDVIKLTKSNPVTTSGKSLFSWMASITAALTRDTLRALVEKCKHKTDCTAPIYDVTTELLLWMWPSLCVRRTY